MASTWRVVTVLCLIVSGAWTLAGRAADPPAAAVAGAVVPDTAKVLVVTEAPPGGPDSIATAMEQALTGMRLTGRALGGLYSVKGAGPKNAQPAAAAAGAGSILHVKVTHRALTDMSRLDYRLEATVTIYQAQGKDWKKIYSEKHETTGSEREVAGLRVSDCDKLADICAELLISRLFPYTLTNFAVKNGKASVDLTIKNTSQLSLKTATVHGPEGVKGLFGTTAHARLDLAPDAEKTVTVTVNSSAGSAADWRKAYVSYLEFPRTDAPGAGGRGGRRKGGARE